MNLTSRIDRLCSKSSRSGAPDRLSRHRVVALAGNPNVGKSTVFNGLTGMKQHTGNWPGKTVSSARGTCSTAKYDYTLVDVPGTYSLLAHSAEEEVARDFLCFEKPDAIIVVCDATCLERNLNLVLQTLELSSHVVLCLNLMDEAHRKGIHVNVQRLAELLGVPVVCTVARKKQSLRHLLDVLDTVIDVPQSAATVTYPVAVEGAIARLKPLLSCFANTINPRWLALRLLENDPTFTRTIWQKLAPSPEQRLSISRSLQELYRGFPERKTLRDSIVTTLLDEAERIAKACVYLTSSKKSETDRRIDRVLTGKLLGYPVMLLLLLGVFWITITAANIPSDLLGRLLFGIQDRLTAIFNQLHAPSWLHGALVLGAYRVLAWVVSVMLPPMAIFFPLFTLLEDVGYLPRIAYNLDLPFHRCHACGKQALTMCMGFGCNAVGVAGCRIIDSPRERLLAILTNVFVPCNGRFPTLIALLTLFFITTSGWLASLLSAFGLAVIILLGIFLTFALTQLLSATLLRGEPSAFLLEMPPYRRPQVGKIVVRSLLDRTLFVLGRAAAVAAPAGLLLWVMSNVFVHGTSLLNLCAEFFDPFAQWMGLDGAILIAFILGFPANEIVVPIILMIYLSQGTLTEPSSLLEIKQVFIDHGWTWTTAASTIVFSLSHWPCSTTTITIYKETKSLKWTVVAILLPTVIGVAICIAFTAVVRLLQ